MALEPNNIESVLRAFAKKRREQAGPDFEMDPATRTVLHEEIAKQWKQPRPRSSRAGWLKSFWPRFALGTGLAALFALSFYAWIWNPIWDGSLATLESQPDRFALLSDSPVDAPLSREEAAGSVDRPADFDGQKLPSPSSPHAPEPDAPRSLAAPSAEPDALPTGPGTVQQGDVFGKVRGDAIPVPDGLAPESERLRFVQTAGERSRLADSRVLSSFSVERDGNEIRIIDADGSIYRGQVTEPPSHNPLIMTRRAHSRSPEPTQSLNPFFISVAGTNQTLQQRVEVQGEIIPGILPQGQTLPAPGIAVQGQRAPQTLRLNPPSPVTSPAAVPSRSTGVELRERAQQPGFRGQVRIGATNQIPIEAVPAVP
jgi:hypothetical protein